MRNFEEKNFPAKNPRKPGLLHKNIIRMNVVNGGLGVGTTSVMVLPIIVGLIKKNSKIHFEW